ncbi:hypothetical protein SAMN05443428_101100 [Caloramator quimbayensis]|uniref:Uncharacterized protein n=1 Tax=Caloramator quimbayensis TaxID=1147123 RepID=A0A1T4WGT9_9CLOT|nr:hypothetical protein [Caloramator quimbayensis]SKA75851.1 hypothetical protein SAMN05443428_101100 [Caloramator quimbayensis]
MKKYKIKPSIYLIFPIIISTVIVFYIIVMYKKSFPWVNIVNIGFDVIILLYYILRFCYKIEKDEDNIYIYTFLKTYRIPLKEYEGAIYTSVLIKINTKTKNFYLLNVKKDRYIIKEILGDKGRR